MWRNGTGHRAVRSSGPRSHASGQDNAKKSTNASKNIVAAMLEAQASHAGDEEARQQQIQSRQAERQKRLAGGMAGAAILGIGAGDIAAAAAAAAKDKATATKKEGGDDNDAQAKKEELTDEQKEEKRRLLRAEMEKKVAALRAEMAKEEEEKNAKAASA